MFELSLHWFVLMIDVSLKATLLAGVTGVLLIGWRVRSSSLKHAAWLGVLSALIGLPLLSPVLPRIPIPLPLRPASWLASPVSLEYPSMPTIPNGSSPEFTTQDERKSEPATSAIDQQLPSSPAIGATAAPVTDSAALGRASPRALPATSVPPAAPWMPVLALIWAMGTLLFCARLALAISLTGRLVNRATPIPGTELPARAALTVLEVNQHPVSLRESPLIFVPLTTGWWRPSILLPAAWTAWSPEKLGHVLVHEFTHIRRGDCWTAVAAEFVACVYWFHPLAWWLRQRLSALAEECCDDAAIGATGDRASYARHLLEIASVLCNQHRRLDYAGLAMAKHSQVERRILTILDADRPLSQRLTRSAALLIAAVIVPLITMAAALKPADETSNDAGAVAPQVQRARELIYLFRQHRVFVRDEEWARNIRELVEIGKPAVPELVAELDRTDHNSTLRSLGFTLRAIGDKRAVAALIRAIPKTNIHGGSDCLVTIVDPELRRFMQQHQNHPVTKDEKGVACGRPVNEITTALEKLTGVPTPHPGGGKEDDRRERWLAWWKIHQREYPEDAELKAVARRPKQPDLVEAAGLAKYGPLFPTGADWRLGPVREVTLESIGYLNAKAFFDFDTGRLLEHMEGWTRDSAATQAEPVFHYVQWLRDQGVDVRFSGQLDAYDLAAWQIDDDRWESLDQEIRAGEPLELGRETTTRFTPADNKRNEQSNNGVGTFLFTTREGGRGVMQVFPPAGEEGPRRFQYRMFESVTTPPAQAPAQNATPKSKTRFGKTVTVTLPSVAKDVECLLDLDTERTAALPKDYEAAIDNPRSPFHDAEAAKWCQEHGIDVVGKYTARNPEEEAARAAGAGAFAGPPAGIQLHGLGLTAIRVLPKSFYSMSIEEVQELLERQYHQPPEVARMHVQFRTPDMTETYAIRTREGSIGLIKLEIVPDEPGKIRLRYRLHSASKKAE